MVLLKQETLAKVREAGQTYEGLWEELCDERCEYRCVEMVDRVRRCYGRLTLPSETLFVWYRDRWIAATESDEYGSWEPVGVLVTPHD